MKRLTEAEIAEELARTPGWERDGDAVRKAFAFPSFEAAIQFVNNVARLAEEANHHPDILVRCDQVVLTLRTHDAGGLTGRDFRLARAIDAAPRP